MKRWMGFLACVGLLFLSACAPAFPSASEAEQAGWKRVYSVSETPAASAHATEANTGIETEANAAIETEANPAIETEAEPETASAPSPAEASAALPAEASGFPEAPHETGRETEEPVESSAPLPQQTQAPEPPEAGTAEPSGTEAPQQAETFIRELPPQATEEPERITGAFIGNVNSKKFHKSSCSSLPAEKNRIYFDSREEAVAEGYEPCQRCRP